MRSRDGTFRRQKSSMKFYQSINAKGASDAKDAKGLNAPLRPLRPSRRLRLFICQNHN
jgi:hypothetical protein